MIYACHRKYERVRSMYERPTHPSQQNLYAGETRESLRDNVTRIDMLRLKKEMRACPWTRSLGEWVSVQKDSLVLRCLGEAYL